MKKLSLLLLIILTVLMTNACREVLLSDVNNPDEIFANYHLRYKANTSGTYTSEARVAFRNSTGLNYVRLDGESTITFNGEELEYSETGLPNVVLGGNSYIGTFESYVNQAEFEYKDADENTYTNLAPLNSVGIAPGTNLTLQLGDSLEIFWEGSPVGENEEVDILFGWFSRIKAPLQDQIGAESIWIKVPEESYVYIDTIGMTPDTLMSPNIGENEFSIIRRTDDIKDLNQPGEGGKMKVIYEAGPYILNIVE